MEKIKGLIVVMVAVVISLAFISFGCIFSAKADVFVGDTKIAPVEEKEDTTDRPATFMAKDLWIEQLQKAVIELENENKELKSRLNECAKPK